jgi:hypothetical protein
MISKNLFQAVILDPQEKDLEMHNDPVIIYGPYNSLVVSYKFGYRGYYPKGFDQTINIYELAHKCKEYAMNNDYCLNSFTDYNGTWFSYANNVGSAKQFSAETEYEAIFKACQFILDEQKGLENE